jgi:hypothetical protein
LGKLLEQELRDTSRSVNLAGVSWGRSG